MSAASLLLTGSLAAHVLAQPVQPPNGPRRTDPAWHALTGAKIVPEPGVVIEKGTIVIRDGAIVSVGADMEAPAGARVWDCSGLTIYAGLVEPYLPVATPPASGPGVHWNPLVQPERSVLDGAGATPEQKKRLRDMGYGAAAIVPEDGLFRGVGALVSLAEQADPSRPQRSVLDARLWHVVAFATAGGSWTAPPEPGAAQPRESSYPGSKMGSIALMRQTLADAEWYSSIAAGGVPPAGVETNDALAALARTGSEDQLPLLFDVDNELDLLRADRIAREFKWQAAAVGSGSEYQRLAAVTATQMPLIIPLNYPRKPRVESAGDRESVSLTELMAWEQAPTNLRRLDAAGAGGPRKLVAITTAKLPREQNFFDNLRSAIRHGLSEERALAMLTTGPAELLGQSHLLGKIAPGYAANLVVLKGGLFDKDREIRDVWVDGIRYEIKAEPSLKPEGEWVFGLEGAEPSGLLKISAKNEITFEPKVGAESKEAEEPKAPAEPAPEQAADQGGEAEGGEPEGEAGEAEAAEGEEEGESDQPEEEKKEKKKSFRAREVRVLENRIDFVLDGAAMGAEEGVILVSAIVEGGEMTGTAELPGGTRVRWSGTKRLGDVAAKKETKEEEEEQPPQVPETYGLPFGPFALSELPAQEPLLVTNATIWTCGPQGVIRGGYMSVRDGKVERIGEGTPGPADGYRVIDAKGMHVSPGLIDCHSHTGISGGVNEGTQSCTAEVRIFDVIDPDAIGWYRELAGGLTCANQLHGSANAIGGQNSVVKLRWGVRHPDEMRFEGASPGIKFALGENVKQSNWESASRTRYPQTRMGVETYIRDRFTAAKEYAARKSAPGGHAVRRDLELEALAEILAGERLVHCHSYRQDEILMLCRVARDFGFRIGTFQHVLEGYKVAEAIREHAIGGSSFSDWWAYKMEVFDAIPYSGAIMHDAGVCVSFNSDSDELARRMNVEAGKAVKYGGVPPEEALKFVTLNPAKQLRIDRWVGSLEPGKDADFVIWSVPASAAGEGGLGPMSAMARCERTFIDGREYFSIERDAQLRAAARDERLRITQKLLAQQKGRDGDGPGGRAGEAGAPEQEGGPRPGRRPRGLDRFLDGQQASAMETYYDWMTLNGLDPFLTRAGECGCGDCGAMFAE